MEYYTIIILVPSGGHRIVLNAVEADVEIKHDYIQATKTGKGYKSVKSKPNATYLDILLRINNATPDQFLKIKKKIMEKELFIHFKDAHPALIKGRIKSLTMDSRTTEIRFTGNTTDKTYHDYVTETTNQLNAQQLIWNESNDNVESYVNPFSDLDPVPDPGFKKKVHFNKQKKRKDKVLKRKLTF